MRVIVYFAMVYGLGGLWLWWFFGSNGTMRLVMGIALMVVTFVAGALTVRRGRRLRSPWEWIPNRAITHGGVGGGTSRWHRDRSERPDDPGDFEAHVGGGL